LVENFLHPVVVEPDSAQEGVSDAVNQVVSFSKGGRAMNRANKLVFQQVFDGQVELPVPVLDIQHADKCPAKIRFRHFHPDRMDVGPHQITVSQVNSGRCD
jgi:hypothetical protein